jgi:hypothetical protein
MQTEVWLWSEALMGTVEGLTREPAEDVGAQRDGLRHDRLVRLLHKVEVAREQYRRGKGESLRILYDYLRSRAGDDVEEQVQFALRDLPPLLSSS